jgi:hypothetical protein
VGTFFAKLTHLLDLWFYALIVRAITDQYCKNRMTQEALFHHDEARMISRFLT